MSSRNKICAILLLEIAIFEEFTNICKWFFYYLYIWILAGATYSSMTSLGIKYDIPTLFYNKTLMTEFGKIHLNLSHWMNANIGKRKRLTPNTAVSQ